MDERWLGSDSFLAERLFFHAGVHYGNFAELCSKAQGKVLKFVFDNYNS